MTRKQWLFFWLACCIKLAVAVLIHPGQPPENGATATFAVRGGDTFSYLDPIENLLQHGTYAQDLARLDTYAGRMPGYGLVYGGLRLVLGPGGAADGVVILQLLLSLYALYCLGRLAQTATQRPAAFQWTVLLFAANTFTTVFDIRLLTESFAISALIIGVYLFGQAQRRASAGLLLGAGCWLAWMVFLRPFLAPLLGLLVGWHFVRALVPASGNGRARLRRSIWRGALLVLPFLVADGAWMARNWAWYHRPVPLQSNTWAGYKTAPGLKELTSFVGTIGEEPAWWNAGTDIAWFYQPATESAPNFRGEAGKLAPPAYTYDSLAMVRNCLLTAQDSTRPLRRRQAAEAKATRALVAYTRAYPQLRPFRACILVPCKLAYRLVLAHPGDYLFQQPFAELPALKKGLKILVHLWYLSLVALGMVGTVWVGWQSGPEALIVKAVPIYLIILLCGVLHLVDARYFALAYPFVVVSAVNLLLIIIETVRGKTIVGNRHQR